MPPARLLLLPLTRAGQSQAHRSITPLNNFFDSLLGKIWKAEHSYEATKLKVQQTYVLAAGSNPKNNLCSAFLKFSLSLSLAGG